MDTSHNFSSGYNSLLAQAQYLEREALKFTARKDFSSALLAFKHSQQLFSQLAFNVADDQSLAKIISVQKNHCEDRIDELQRKLNQLRIRQQTSPNMIGSYDVDQANVDRTVLRGQQNIRDTIDQQFYAAENLIHILDAHETKNSELHGSKQPKPLSTVIEELKECNSSLKSIVQHLVSELSVKDAEIKHLKEIIGRNNKSSSDDIVYCESDTNVVQLSIPVLDVPKVDIFDLPPLDNPEYSSAEQ